MGSAAQNPLGVEWFGLVMGLGLVLYFGYWCMDFRVIQRAMAAGSLSAARRTPLVAAIPKMFFPFLAILPGMIALAVSTGSLTLASQGRTIAQGVSSSVAYVRSMTCRAQESKAANNGITVGRGIIPPKINRATRKPLRDKDGRIVLDYDLATPIMLIHYFSAGMLGLELTALLALFMSGMAGKVAAFNTV